MKRPALLILSIMILTGLDLQRNASAAQAEKIKNIQNPDHPAKGTILLEVEKRREINPYDNAEIDLKFIDSARMDDGRIVLFDASRSKVYIFSPEGRFLKDLVKNGEGPGEFPPQRTLAVHPMKDRLFITGGNKLAKFDKQGVFLEDLKIEDTAVTFVDESSYITISRGRRDKDFQTPKKAVLKKIQGGGNLLEGPVFKEGLYRDMLRNPDSTGGFSDDLIAPSILYAYDPLLMRVSVAEKDGCRIEAFDLSGKKLFTAEAPFSPYKISRREVEDMHGTLLKNMPMLKWIIDAYPDKLMPIIRLTSMPNGYLAVHRIVGPRKFEINIFDRNGIWQYALKLPDGVKLQDEHFYDFGFSNIETRDDYLVYVEYRIKNLPEIFSGK